MPVRILLDQGGLDSFGMFHDRARRAGLHLNRVSHESGPRYRGFGERRIFPGLLPGETGDDVRCRCGGHLVERSEEHTSELQSLMRISYAVFCLKKKRKRIRNSSSINYQQTKTH